MTLSENQDAILDQQCKDQLTRTAQIWGEKKKDFTYARYQEKYIQNKNILILIMGTKA